MRSNKVARRSGIVVLLAAFGVLLFGIGAPANAAALIYQADNVTIKVSGGEATALNNCLNDAQDGIINTQINACDQIASAGNLVALEDVSLFVFAYCGCGFPLFSDSNVDIEVTGGIANAINSCVNDSLDGVINTQINNCRQVATAGNLITLRGVSVGVYR